MKCIQYMSTQMMSDKPLNGNLQKDHLDHLNRKAMVGTKKMSN